MDMSEFVGRSRAEVMKAVAEQCGQNLNMPGLEYQKYLLENPDQFPEEMKDGKFYYFMGSTIRVQDGYTNVPATNWVGNKQHQLAGWLDHGWGENDRVVVIEK